MDGLSVHKYDHEYADVSCHMMANIVIMNVGGHTMATMNVSLPDPMKDWVDVKISEGQYSSASDYVRDLIRRDQQRNNELEALRLAIKAGEDSGVSKRTMDQIWKAARIRAQAEPRNG